MSRFFKEVWSLLKEFRLWSTLDWIAVVSVVATCLLMLFYGLSDKPVRAFSIGGLVASFAGAAWLAAGVLLQNEKARVPLGVLLFLVGTVLQVAGSHYG